MRNKIIGLLCLCVLLCGCQVRPNVTSAETTAAKQTKSVELATMQVIDTQETDVTTAEKPTAIQSIPVYEGRAYIDIQGNKEALLQKGSSLSPGEYVLSPWDELGRCGPALLCANAGTIPTGDRESTGQARPSGWNQNKYPGLVDSDPPYLYNRAHLLMWALSGLTDNVQNLITGTRCFNTECMLPTEMEILSYVKSGGTVIYEVTPIFDGDNLLASGVIMEAVSTDGSFYLCRYAFNVQPGVEIDYATGENWLAGENRDAASQEKATYILNTGTKKFHHPDCDSVKQMKPKNKQKFTGTRQEAIDMGYKPCGACTP